MKTKANAEPTAAKRRESLAADVQTFLKAGNSIKQIPSGVSAQDPQGRVKPLRLAKGKVQEPDPGGSQQDQE